MRPISAQGMTISTAITLYHEKPVLQNSRTSPKLKKTWKTAKPLIVSDVFWIQVATYAPTTTDAPVRRSASSAAANVVT
jgi:hypothetical protein